MLIRKRQAELLAPVVSSALKNLRLAGTEDSLTRMMKDLQKSSPQMRHALEVSRRAGQRAGHQRPAGGGQPEPGQQADEHPPEP